MNELTIVTAFFDIGREKFKNTIYTRSSLKYIEQFQFWAGLRNKLIIYTQPEFSTKIKEIREGFNLLKKTEIIEIANVFSIEADLYKKMKKVESNPEYALWGMNPNALRNRADYDYIMLMKYWCLKDAVKFVDDDAVLAWMDFGFNHGGDLYVNSKEFDFLWKNKNFFEDRRIWLFALFDPKEALLCESLQLMYVCIMGCMLIVPQELSKDLWKLTKKAMKALLMLDAIDDDQQLLAMAYKDTPEIFNVYQSEWFLPLKEFGGEHLTCRPKYQNSLEKDRQDMRVKKYLHKIKKAFKKKEKQLDKSLDEQLANRILAAAQKYYIYR